MWALVLMGDFLVPGICWRDKARHKLSRKFLECTKDHFRTQRTGEPTSRASKTSSCQQDAHWDVNVKDSRGWKAHKLEFRILRGGAKMNKKITTLNFRRVDFRLFKALLGRVLSDKALEEEGHEKGGLYAMNMNCSRVVHKKAKMPGGLHG